MMLQPGKTVWNRGSNCCLGLLASSRLFAQEDSGVNWDPQEHGELMLTWQTAFVALLLALAMRRSVETPGEAPRKQACVSQTEQDPAVVANGNAYLGLGNARPIRSP